MSQNETVETPIEEEIESNIEEVENNIEEQEEVENTTEEESIIETPAEDEEEDIISFGDEETPPQEEDNEKTPLIKELRQTLKEASREKKALKKKLEEIEKNTQVEKEVTLGNKPTLEASDYDEELYQARLDDWYETKSKVESKNRQQELKQLEEQKEWQNTVSNYEEKKVQLKVSNYEDSEDNVKDTLSDIQQGLILASSINPAVVVYALGKNQAKLDELSKINDHIKFAVAIARLETQLKHTKKKSQPPKPESKVKGGGSSGTVDSTLDRLREEATKSGDFSKVHAYKKKQRDK